MGRRTTTAIVVAVLVTACGGTDEAAETVTVTETVTATPSASASASAAASAEPDDEVAADDDVVADETGVAADGSQPDDPNPRTLARLEEARGLWAGQTGLLYVWSYREEGEGMQTDFCVEGVAGSGGSDAAACPFEAFPGGLSVDEWLDAIAEIIAFAGESGRMVEAEFDATYGYPLFIDIFGGERDSLAITTLDFLDEGDAAAEDSDHPDFAACDGGDPDACYRYGLAQQPPVPSFGSGNAYSQAPDDAVVADCRDGDPQACYEVGFRGLDNPRA